jgi:lysozyme
MATTQNTTVQSAGVLGIDVSIHNGAINWQKVAQDPQTIKFVYAKATEGSTLRDTSFSANRAGANAVGLPVGAYHFYSLTTPPVRQAHNFVSVVEHLNVGDLPPVLDFENEIASNQINQVIQDLHAWLKTVESELGVRPIIYTAYNYWHNFLQNNSSFNNYKLWVAQYGANGAPAMRPPALFGGWNDWAIWQYTSKGVVQGIQDFRGRPTDVDLNRYNASAGLFNPAAQV